MRGIFHKIDELLISLIPNAPHVLCLIEHHLRTDEISLVKTLVSILWEFIFADKLIGKEVYVFIYPMTSNSILLTSINITEKKTLQSVLLRYVIHLAVLQ
jgi:hypothetical protein